MKQFFSAGLLAAALCLAAGPARAADNLTMADFGHSIKLSVEGYTGTETLTNFPVLVRVSEAGITGFRYEDTSSWNKNHDTTYGYDLAFFAEDGTRLASEVDTWIHEGESLAWVKLPQLNNGVKFYMCYNVADGVYVTNDNPWDDYVGVWHLKETGGSGKVVNDSSPNGMQGKTYGGATYASSPIGAGRKIAGDKNHAWGIVVDATNGTQKAAADSLGTDFSASFWMKPDASDKQNGDFSYGFLIDRRKGEYNNPGGWGVRFHANNSNQLQFYAADELLPGLPANDKYNGTLTSAYFASLYTRGTWRKVDIRWYATNENAGAADIYVDGVFVETVALPKAPKQDGTTNIGIGGSTADTPANNEKGKGRRFNGYMDEVRLRSGGLSADWVKADYDTVNDQSFVIVAPPETLTVDWANGSSATPGVEEMHHNRAVFAGTVTKLGEGGAESCAIEAKVWEHGAAEPENWTALANGLVVDDAFSASWPGLSAETPYDYVLRAVGNNGAETNSVAGTFTTLPALGIAWATGSGTTGFSKVSSTFATIGGTVATLGDATSCDVRYKIWLSDDEEPSRWTTFAEGLAAGDSFSTTVTDTAVGAAILPGTAYAYALLAVGSDGEEASVSGTFTTSGDPGETVGSEYTHFFDDGTNACWVVDGFERYLPFTVTGYTGTETLTNFPVLVDVRDSDTNGFRYSDFYHYDGSDMAFVDDTGHIIPHEIDTWNKNGMSLIWVRLPRMNNGTTFTMCYRSPLIDPLPDVGNTFEKYVGVWHMNETQNGVTSIKDSTANNLAGESHAKSLAGINQGQMIGGNARRVAQETGTSSSNGRIMVYDHDDILRNGVGNVFTFSGWYKTADAKPNWAYLVARKGDDYSKGWGVQYADDNAVDKLRVWSDPLGSKAVHSNSNPGGYYHFGITTYSTDKAVGYKHTDWAYWTFVFSNNTFHAYHNGTELSSTVGGFTLEQPFANDETADFDYLVIGGMEFGTGAFNGYVDEARYSKGVRSADWIKAEYDSTRQKDAPFVTKGTVSTGQDSPVPVVVWEQGANLPLSIIDVSYAYVQFAGMVTFCGVGAYSCRVEYQLWADGEEDPTVDGAWTTLGDLAEVTAGTSFSVPVTGLKQDMPYNFRIRAVNTIAGGVEQANREITGSFRTSGNISESGEGDLLRVDNRFVHRYPAGSYTFTTPDYVTSVEILVVGGGGAGGYKIGGGGGGGGLFYSASYPVETNTTYHIQVGEGGNAASNLDARGENGQLSYFARKDGDNEGDETILISVPGGGAGGSYANIADIATGADGGSGGGGTSALAGGQPVSNEVDGVWVAYGYEGGQGNDSKTGGNQSGKTAAGGGGGAGREGVTASFDSWYGGGAGGAGLANSMTGERLFYGAGGGGGYAYKFDNKGNYSKPGAGGSGIGGNAADVRNGTPATSGVENTGAGGGGGSMILNNQTDQTYWQGGHGGDGVVLIAYEIHGREPISDDPCVTLMRCSYDPEGGDTSTGEAEIDFRVYWAGVQTYTNDVYVLYSTVGEEDLAEGNGERVKIASGAVGIGTATFVPPEVGHTYWIRLMARKDANSVTYSDEIASFYVPAVTLKATTWKKQNSASADYAIVDYKLHDLDEATHLYCYWSESREALEGDDPPSGDGVRLLDLGTGKANASTFNLLASEGLSRNRLYYLRLAAGDAKGLKLNLSRDILPLDTSDNPAVALLGHEWNDNVATLQFRTTLSFLDPADTTLFAYYSTIKTDVENNNLIPTNSARFSFANLGLCSAILDEKDTTASFPLWATESTNYYVKIALYSASNKAWYRSGSTRTITITTPIAANTLLIIANANPKMGCYGDAPQALDCMVSYGGLTDGPGFEHKPPVVGEPACAVTATSKTGQYDITQGTIELSNADPWVDPATETTYQYKLVFAGAKYAITNVVFTAVVADVEKDYSGDSLSVGDLTKSETGVRNSQTVTYSFREGSGEWLPTPPDSYVDAGTYTVQFKASAQNHDSTYGTFQVVVKPAPLKAEISAANLVYTGEAQTPVVTTNVSGLVRGDLNPLTCEFRDEAGEWQAEVPTFTQPGTYTLWFRASAPNHTTAVTNCTFTISGWDFRVNMDGQSGYPTTIRVTDPAWFIRNSGHTGEELADDDTRNAALDARCANGLKLWQNYVLEREIDDALVAAIHQACPRVATNHFELRFPNVNPLGNTGLAVDYRLDRRLAGEAAFSEGPRSDKYEMNVPLGPSDPTGLYVFNIVLSTTNDPVARAVLPSCATVGVLRVSSPATNVVAAVPWMSMASTKPENEPVEVAETVNPNGLSVGDRILAYSTASNFQGWAHLSRLGTDWGALEAGETDGVAVVTTNTTRFARGGAFWLVRTNPGDCFYLLGRYTGDEYTTEIAGGTAAAPAYTLVANPTMAGVNLNALVFVDGSGDPATPAAGDRIVVQDAAGFQKFYVRNAANTEWGRYVSGMSDGRVTQSWESGAAVAVPSGTGFWYVRTDPGPLAIRFGGAQ